MLEEACDFGPELRRRRLYAGLSLEQLSRRVHYSKAQLSKVERGLKRPTPELARLCDAQLKADGALAGLLPAPPPQPPQDSPDHDSEVWLMHVDKDGSSSIRRMTRRRAISAGAMSALALQTGSAPVQPPPDEAAATVVDAARLIFDQLRRLGQSSGPTGVLPALVAQIQSLERLAAHAGSRTRRDLLLIASRYAEYAGWMAQECGKDSMARWWTTRAVHLADAGDDPDIATYSYVRHSLISLYRGDVAEAGQLAERALRSDASSRIRGLAAQHLAQSAAVAGEHTACMHHLDRARVLLARDVADPGQPVLGTSHLPDVVSMFTGWCLYDLGRPAEAAALLDRETARIPAHALRTRGRHNVRRALAHAAAGEVDHACGIAADALASVRLTRSATVAADLRRLAHTLARHRGRTAVSALAPDLAVAITATSAS
ncbi:helix-turn-helix domain-containing protein [Streptomyces flavofungini]|uniref:helix-turn-helix domain-containing protein n=1 Tax=Streptomyces flavofungini TaxID=68200 RepID=UPI0025AFE958|nr:helix-turn-helix transcriptional regulator [Streptomyces flavofungini]WJV50057.1 helix-turn-helix transcriptional regulator [Streptomyces flavofungini]